MDQINSMSVAEAIAWQEAHSDASGLVEAIQVEKVIEHIPEPEAYVIAEIDMSEEYHKDATCPECETRLYIPDLSRSAAVCPGCGAGLAIDGPAGPVCKPPQKMRHQSRPKTGMSVKDWSPTIEDFGELIDYPVRSLPMNKRTHWANKLQEVAQSSVKNVTFTPEQVSRALVAMKDSGDHTWRKWTSPFSHSFVDALGKELAAFHLKLGEYSTVLEIKPGDWKY